MRRLFVALQFLTIIPFRKQMEVSEEDLGKSMYYFPLVGIIIGGFLALINEFLMLILPRIVVDGILITVLVVLTGALHLDGLADTIDGIARKGKKSEKLAYMKDGRIGAMGAAGVVLILLLKCEALHSLSEASKLPVLVLMPAVGRWAQVVVAFFSEYASDQKGMGSPFTTYVSFYVFFSATLLVFFCSFLFLGVKGVAAAFGIGLFCLFFSSWFRRALGGVTGDVLGAANELAELLFLLLSLGYI